MHIDNLVEHHYSVVAGIEEPLHSRKGLSPFFASWGKHTISTSRRGKTERQE